MTTSITIILGVFILGVFSRSPSLLKCSEIVHGIFLANDNIYKSISQMLIFNVGRIIAVTLLGLVAGLAGKILIASLVTIIALPNTMLIKGYSVATAVIFILMGLYIIGWQAILLPLTKMGGVFWRFIYPITKTHFFHNIALNGAIKTLTLGAIYGIVPCGLTYSVFIIAFVSQSPFLGSLNLLAFALGALPNMLLMGWGFPFLSHWRTQTWYSIIVGLMVILWGSLLIFD